MRTRAALSFSMLDILAALAGLCAALEAHAEYVPNHKDSGWVRLFNGKDLTGLYPHVEGSAWGVNPGGIVTVHDSLIHFYAGRKRANRPAAPNGVLSTDVEFGHYRSRVEYRHGDYANDGWLAGDPYNSGFFFHAKPGGPAWPPAIECQLKIHWNGKAGKPCTAAAGDCDQKWAGDYWLLSGVQIAKDGALSPLSGGCCNPTFGTHTPDREKDDWNTMEIEVHGDSLFRNILNGHEVNHGGKSTWQDASGKRVPLKQGRVQLELEGSEFLFRNWEIRLFPKDSLYAKWYVEGCMDPAFKEYSAAANLHVASLCKTAATAVMKGGGLEVNRSGWFRFTLTDVAGRVVAQRMLRGPTRHDIPAGLPPGIYFAEVRAEGAGPAPSADRFRIDRF